MSFKANDKVVCIDASGPNYPDDLIVMPDRLTKGAIYVIREALSHGDLSGPGGFKFKGYGQGIRLTGVWTGTLTNGDEAAWTCLRFRPLDELQSESRSAYYRERPELQPT